MQINLFNNNTTVVLDETRSEINCLVKKPKIFTVKFSVFDEWDRTIGPRRKTMQTIDKTMVKSRGCG